MTMKKSPLMKRNVFFASLLLFITTVVTWIGASAPSGAAQSTGGFSGAMFDVKTNPQTSSLPVSDGPFYLEGSIYPVKSLNDDGSLKPDVDSNPCATGGKQLGVWRAWGLKKGDTLVTNQEFWMPCYNAVIEVQGVLGRTTLAIEGSDGKVAESLAVSGGLGTLRTTFGEAQLKALQVGPLRIDTGFRVYLLETNRRSNDNWLPKNIN